MFVAQQLKLYMNKISFDSLKQIHSSYYQPFDEFKLMSGLGNIQVFIIEHLMKFFDEKSEALGLGYFYQIGGFENIWELIKWIFDLTQEL